MIRELDKVLIEQMYQDLNNIHVLYILGAISLCACIGTFIVSCCCVFKMYLHCLVVRFHRIHKSILMLFNTVTGIVAPALKVWISYQAPAGQETERELRSICPIFEVRTVPSQILKVSFEQREQTEIMSFKNNFINKKPI